MSTPDALIADRYRLVRKLGSGGMGVVWEAWDERLHRRVALKQLRPQPGLSPEEVELTNHRALREARINARLHHRYAVPVFDVVEHHGQPCLIMQFVSSVPLSQVLREGGPLEPAEAAQVGAQVGSALAEAHQAGIVHRDIKPGNILIADDGTALISDFGISHAMGDVTLTQTGMVHGTPAYLAPEVARGGTASFASDVFSLGATLYAALEGSPPFGTDPNSIALLFKVAAGTFDEPQRSGPLTPVLADMLAADPQARPDMATVARRLTALATTEPGHNLLAAEDSEDDHAAAAVPPASPEAPAPARTPESQRTTRVAPRENVEPVEATEVAQDQRTTVARSDPPTPTLLAADAVTPRRTISAADGPAGGPPAAPYAPGDQPGDQPRRRTNRVLAAVVAVLVLAGLITALAIAANRNGANTAAPSPSAAQPETTAASADPTPTPSASPSDEPSNTPTPTPSASPTPSATPKPSPSPSKPSGGTPTAGELAGAVSNYYSKMPGDRDAGWDLLTPSYQRKAGGRGSYNGFWGGIRKVSVGGVSGDPPDRAQATLTYTYKDGRVVKEKTSFQVVRDDGVLKINDSTVQQSN